MSILNRNPSNTNYLQGSKFQVMFPRITSVTYFCQSVNIPGLATTSAIQPTPFSDLKRPGDKLRFGEFRMKFIIDEELFNYQILSDWIRGYTFPCSFEEYRTLNRQSMISLNAVQPQYSDGQLKILSALNNPKVTVKFINIFPVSLSDIEFNTMQSADDVITAIAEFHYHLYGIER